MIHQITNIVGENIMSAFTWTLIHSLWQGSIIALLMSLMHTSLKEATPSLRYNISVGALLTLVASSILTFVIYYSSSSNIDNIGHVVAQSFSDQVNVSNIHMSTIQNIRSWCDSQSETIFIIWISGISIFVLKMILSLIYLQYLKQGFDNSQLSYSMNKMKRKLEIAYSISILESAKVSVPMVIGFIKPIILFPLGVVNILSTEEIEGIIAHELAHIKRHDFIINIIQTIVEILYYYHPAVWWISANIKAERENSCDDIAIRAGMQPLTYAKSLLKLEEFQTQKTPALAMALSSDSNQLLNRVKRILNMQQTKNNIKEKSIATILLLTFTLLFSNDMISNSIKHTTDLDKVLALDMLPSTYSNVQSNTITLVKPRVSIVPQMTDMNIQNDTIPKTRSKVSVHTETNGKVIKLEKENGEITLLEIDGKVIPESEYDEHKELTKDIIIMDGGPSSRIMFFGHGEDFPEMNFEFNTEDMLEKLQDMEHNFAIPEMRNIEDMMKDMDIQRFQFDGDNLEKLNDMMKSMQDQMGHLRMDTILNFDIDTDTEDMYFRFDSDDDGGNTWFQRGGDSSSNTVSSILGSELNRDGLLEPYKPNKVELTGKYLKINGDKQPKNIWSKYKRIYEEQTGMLLTKKSRVDFEVEGKKSTRKIRTF